MAFKVNVKAIAKTTAKIVVSTCLIALAVRASDPAKIQNLLRNAELWGVVLATGILLAASLAHTARWLTVIRAGGDSLGYAQAWQMVLVGNFFNQLLPSSVGGDTVRVWRAVRAGMMTPNALNSVILDRLTALAGLLIVTSASLPWLLPVIKDPQAQMALIVLMLAIVSGFVALITMRRLPESFAQWRLLRFLMRLSTVSNRLFLDVRHSVPAVGLSTFMHLISAGVAYILARSLGTSIGSFECLVLVPIVTLVTMFPISIAGWGVREGAMVVSFGLAGVPANEAFALSVLTGIVIMLAGIPGGVIWFLTGHRFEQPIQPSQDDSKS